jgi:ankyrin repeat protein
MSSFLQTAKVNTMLTKNQKLIRAVYKSNYDEITRLLQNGADINSSTKSHETPVLSIAIERNDITAIHLLLEHAPNVNKSDKNGHTPLMFACMNNDLTPVVEDLVSRGANVKQRDNDGKTAFFFAAMYGSIPSMECLLRHGENVNVRDKWGKTPLICTIEMKNQTNIPNFENTIRFLLENGASVTIEGNNHKNVLAYAEEEGVSEDVIHLLESHFPTQAVATPSVPYGSTVAEVATTREFSYLPYSRASYIPMVSVRKITGGKKRKTKSRNQKSIKRKTKTLKKRFRKSIKRKK